MKKFSVAVVFGMVAFAVLASIPDKNERQKEEKQIDGYKTTPMQPDGKWHIHDPDRPQPPVAEPKYDGKPVPAPADAKVIFDGSNLDQFRNKQWVLKDGYMGVGKGEQKSKEKFGDMHLHVEWMIPAGISGWGQKRGNSGVFLMGHYEIQVLDCWANRTYPDGMTGALYGQKPPLVNACRKPGEWQCYDIYFTAPVFKDGKLVSPAIVTVYLNNVLVQDKSEFRGATIHKKTPCYKPHDAKESFVLQSHKNPVCYRNIWVQSINKK